MTRVLMVLTGTDTWMMKDGTRHPTGFWMEELVKPHKTFSEAGYEIVIATPGGRAPTVDPLSLALEFNKNDQAEVDSQKSYLSSLDSELASPRALADIDPDDQDVIFVVGGHGPMQDLAVDADIGKLLAAFLGAPNKLVAAVCHGPASFLAAHDNDGNWLFRGRKLTAFSNVEETQSSFAGNAPWLLEDRLRLAGGIYESKPAWTPHTVTDGNLVTGQQNYSAQATADAVIAALPTLAPA